MKFALRRSPEPFVGAADEAAPPPTPPRGAPVSAYAAVLDGRTLWLAVGSRPGALALRGPAGDVLPLVSDLVEDPTEHLSVRADLLALLPPGEASYDVVVVPERGGRPVPVWTAPLPPLAPARVPVTGDGRQLGLQRGDDGTLRLVQSVAPAGVELAEVTLDDDALVLHLPGATGEVLLLADLDDRPVLSLTRDGDRALLRLADLPPPADVATRVVVGTAEAWRPVVRPRNDLANPGHAAQLPALADPEDGHTLVRLRWRPGGVLAVRLHPELEQA